MGRPRTIDRERLLDVAQEIVAASGASALSFGSLAAAAGLSKASVQSVFTTREGLIEAMLVRWNAHERRRFDALAGDAPTPRERVLAHLRTIVSETPETNRRMAVLLAALTGGGEPGDVAAAWYAERVGDLSATTDAERRQRLAFLAAEGAFYMRHLAGVPMSDALWRDIFSDLERVLGD